ncbi:flagellar hook capping FlgD N-terminal domain-containing protein [Pararhodobacter sp. SW119]|uniref:flagellar hook capping FlgD N-terminal domain-containing protein n=1 Tax=Pararhodobacter sp. SW119 TaxID=2780075 RepID=UPI001AE04BE5|nr:flagellar hook capping FlgD N-terminal domain-containing protein [Pararhodobacter sp. SW119]
MDITSATQANGARGGASQGAAANNFAQSDYMTFLRMLTVQMQNQDPLNPMSSSDFAVQLATFSGVEQQTQTNQLLQTLMGRMGLADLGGWVGMEVRSDAGAWFEEAPVDLDPVLPAGAERGIVLVRDERDSIVATLEVAPGTRGMTWDGLTLEGVRAAPGVYRFTLESYRGDELIDAVPVAAYQTVVEARREGERIELVVGNGALLDSASVSGLRRPREG